MEEIRETVLTVKEAAEYLRIHPITLYRLLEKNKISGGFKIGNQWRFRKEIIERWRVNIREKNYGDSEKREKRIERLMGGVVKCLEEFCEFYDEAVGFSADNRDSLNSFISSSREEIGTVLKEVKNFVKEIKGEKSNDERRQEGKKKSKL